MATTEPEEWEGVDLTHITGDLYFANRYHDGWWMAAALALLFTPPIGAFLLVYMCGRCLTRRRDDVPLYARE